MRKRTIALLVALVMSAGVAIAAQQQHEKMAKMNVDEQVARMKANLTLTDAQAAQVKELFEKQQKEMQAWRQENPNATREVMQTHHEQMMKERMEGLKKILTPEQYKKHEEMMRRGMKHGPKGPPQN